MTVLVTGGAGYIGSHIAWMLAGRGENIVIVDNLSTGRADVVPPSATLVVGDIGDDSVLSAVFSRNNIDSVIHCAALTVVPDSILRPLEYYGNNVSNTILLLDHAVRSGVRRFVFSSTAAVYSDKNTGRVTEESETIPSSPYGVSKLMAEHVFRDAAKAHYLSCVILRYFNVAGADPGLRTGQTNFRATHLFRVCAQAALGIIPSVTVCGTDYDTVDGTGVRDYIHVSDLAQAHVFALDDTKDDNGKVHEFTTLNCGYGRGYSVLDVVAAMKSASGADFPVILSDRRPGDLSYMVANPSALAARYDWKPKFEDINLIAKHALDWERLSASRKDTE